MIHRITINGQEDAEELLRYYGLKKAMCACGETVTFIVPTATDTSYRVTSDEVRITCDGYASGGISTYSFLMPDKDVVVDIDAHSSMVNPFLNGSDMSSMSMMGMGMMGMQPLMNTAPASRSDSYPWEGKPKFCSACGATTEDSNKFCGECGAPLLPTK